MTGNRAAPATKSTWPKKTNTLPKTRSSYPIRHGAGPVVRTEDIVIPFLDFPLAVRTRIFTYMFAPTGILKREDDLWPKKIISPFIRALRACRSVHDEATAVLYGKNEHYFSCSDASTIKNWITRIGPSNILKIRKICLGFPEQCDDHKLHDPHYNEFTDHIDVLRLAHNCALRFHLPTLWRLRACTSCQATPALKRFELTLRRLRDEPCIEVYQRLNLVRRVCLYESGRHGFIEFKTHDRRFRWKQEFLLRDPAPVWLKQELHELDRVIIKQEDDLCILDGPETVEFLHQRKGLSELPDYLITQILNYIVSPLTIVKRELIGDQPFMQGDVDFWNLDESLVALPFPRGLRASKRLLDLAKRMYYTRNTFIFHFTFHTAHVYRAHNLEYVFRWMESCEHRKHARHVRVTLDFGRTITLPQICINIFANRPLGKKSWDASLDIMLCFDAGGSLHYVTMDQVARNISKILYSTHEDLLLDRCLVDGFGNARLYTKRERRLDALWSTSVGLKPIGSVHNRD